MKSFKEAAKIHHEKQKQQKLENRKSLIIGFQNAISEIYLEENLSGLNGPKGGYEVNGIQLLAWFGNVVRKGQKAYPDKNFHAIFDDIVSCGDEVIYFTAILYLYKPYLNHPVKDGYYLYDTMIYPNHVNLEARRYTMFANTVFEKLYNYWDRLGDLIALYLPAEFNPEEPIYFEHVVSYLPKEFTSSENYLWLKTFNKRYKKMKAKRNRIVHSTNLDTDFNHQHLEIVTNKKLQHRLIDDRNGLTKYFKHHIDDLKIGFIKTLSLVEEISNVRLAHISLEEGNTP